MVRELVPDERLLRLIGMWIAAPILRFGNTYARPQGIAQGSPLSPLLANLYLDHLDEAAIDENLRLVRYADDFLILCRSRERADTALELTREVLGRLQLSLHPVKTRITHFDSGFKFLGHWFVRSLVVPAHSKEVSAQDRMNVVQLAGSRVAQHNPSHSEDKESNGDTGEGPLLSNTDFEGTMGGASHNVDEQFDVRESVAPTTAPNMPLAAAGESIWEPTLAPRPDVAEDALDAAFHPPLASLGADEGTASPAEIEAGVPAEPTTDSLLRTLYVVETGTTLARRGELLVVRKDGQDLLQLPAQRVDLVVLVGNQGLTVPAMQLCLLRGVPIALVGRAGGYSGRIDGPQMGNMALQRAQFRAADDAHFSLAIARACVHAKVHNSLTVLRRYSRNRDQELTGEAIRVLLDFERRLKTVETVSQLRGLEGAAAAAYFGAWRDWLPVEWPFPRREARPAPDALNALLSFGYSLVYANVAAMLTARGLNAGLGFYHETVGDHQALASDLMEPLRSAIVDSVVLGLTLNGRLAGDCGRPTQSGFRLSSEACKVMLHAIEARFGASAQYTQRGSPAGSGPLDWRRAIDANIRSLTNAIRSGNSGLYHGLMMR